MTMTIGVRRHPAGSVLDTMTDTTIAARTMDDSVLIMITTEETAMAVPSITTMTTDVGRNALALEADRLSVRPGGRIARSPGI